MKFPLTQAAAELARGFTLSALTVVEGALATAAISVDIARGALDSDWRNYRERLTSDHVVTCGLDFAGLNPHMTKDELEEWFERDSFDPPQRHLYAVPDLPERDPEEATAARRREEKLDARRREFLTLLANRKHTTDWTPDEPA